MHQLAALRKELQWRSERWAFMKERDALAYDTQLAIIQRDGKIQQFQDADFWSRQEIKDLQVNMPSLFVMPCLRVSYSFRGFLAVFFSLADHGIMIERD